MKMIFILLFIVVSCGIPTNVERTKKSVDRTKKSVDKIKDNISSLNHSESKRLINILKSFNLVLKEVLSDLQEINQLSFLLIMEDDQSFTIINEHTKELLDEGTVMESKDGRSLVLNKSLEITFIESDPIDEQEVDALKIKMTGDLFDRPLNPTSLLIPKL
jgi:ABC-type bacteriocin/lantibiotic exporter with double-glycine peptidase domain